jgi:hypothetical protein
MNLYYPATQQGWGLINVECVLLWPWSQPPPQCQ